MSTYTPIASQTLSAAASSVTFSGIPQNYTDLVLVFAGAITTGFDAINMQFNSNTGTNYSRTVLAGNGSSATSSRDSNASSMQIGIMGTEQSNSIWNVMNYSNSTTYKTVLSRGNSSANSVRANVGLWRNTAAITSITITAASSTFISGSTFNLYGIDASLSAQAKATGGTTIIRDSSYWYHVFTGSGTFTPTQAITADVLVVAGGGGTSTQGSGGGGAGGLVYHAGRTVSSAVSVIVGAGGTGVNGGTGGSGSNSVFDTITANGGGGTAYTGGGIAGGSGGGASYNSISGGAATQGNSGGGIGYGNTGGAGSNSGNQGAGGGGGAGAAGSNGTSSAGGAGGAGLNTWSSWATATATGVSGYYAGGGGGAVISGSSAGAGGAGGGGTGGQYSNAVAATNGVANTGGGGGGGGANGAGQATNGGSGIVIIRYAV